MSSFLVSAKGIRMLADGISDSMFEWKIADFPVHSDELDNYFRGYTIEEIMNSNKSFFDYINLTQTDDYRKAIIEDFCDVLVDGRYIEERKDTTLKWRGSTNQRVIDVQESLQQNKIILHCD